MLYECICTGYLLSFLISEYVPDSVHLFCIIVSLFAGEDLQVLIRTCD